MASKIYKQVEDHVINLFEANKKPKLIFHSLGHTQQIVKTLTTSVQKILKKRINR